MHTGEPIQDNDLSRSHSLLFHALNSFLRIARYLSDDDSVKIVAARQGEFCDTLKNYSPRGPLLSGHGVATEDRADLDAMIEDGFSKIAERLRVSGTSCHQL